MAYILRRILYAIPVALGVTIMCFSLIYLGPVHPVDAVAPDDASPEEIEQLKVAYGFDKPIPVQYLIWLGRAIHGDFGFRSTLAVQCSTSSSRRSRTRWCWRWSPRC